MQSAVGQSALLREVLVVDFNPRQTPVKVSPPSSPGPLLVVAVGRSVFTPRPQTGSEPTTMQSAGNITSSTGIILCCLCCVAVGSVLLL